MNETTVFVIDDDESVGDAINLILSLKGMRTQRFVSAEDFLEAYRPEWRGCILTDLQMPRMSGLELQKVLQERGILLPVVLLTAHGDVATTRVAMKGGAFDFLEKPVDAEVLLDVLKNAIREDIQRHAAERAEDALRSRLARLTSREREVLDLLVEGLSQREIAARLAISPRTVEVYKARMMEKLQCRTLAELIRVAL